jgi:hypothetical protein
MAGLEQQITGYNTGVPLPFTVPAAVPGIPTTAFGAGTGITAAAIQYGLKRWIAGRGLTAVGTISTPALAPSNQDVVVTWQVDDAIAQTTGTGLDDITIGGAFTGADPATFEIEITAEGTPDVIRWRKDGGAWTSGVNLTGSAQALSDGVTFTAAATTGHTSGDVWTITCPGAMAIAECYGYRVMRTVDAGTTWVAVADVWGQAAATYTDTTDIGDEPDLDDPADDETANNYGLVQLSVSPADYFHREDGEFDSDELTGDLGTPDVIPGFQTVPAEWPFDLRAGKLVPILATFAGKPTITWLTGAPGAQADFTFAEDEADQVSMWALKYPGGGTRPEIGEGIKFFDLEFSDLGSGLAKCKAMGTGTGWTEAGLGVANVSNTGTYKHVPVVKGRRGDAAAYTSDLEVDIISAASGGTFTWKAKVGAASYGGAGTVMTGYYDTATGRMILGGTNDEPFVEMIDQDGEFLGVDDGENREPFSICWPGDVRRLAVGDKFTILAQGLIPRALKSVGDTTSTGDARRIIRLPRFGPAHVKFLKTVDSVQSKFEFESASLKLSREGTPAYQPGPAGLRPVDVDVTGYVSIELDIDARYRTREIERMKRDNVRFALALEMKGGRIPSAPGVLSSYRETVKQTYAWCRIASFSAPATGPGITKAKIKVVAAQPPDGSAFMPTNRITSAQTWPFHAI